MKYLLLTIVLCLLVAGCGSEFAGGFASGAAAMKVMGDKAQDDFIIAVNELNTETARLNKQKGAVMAIDPAVFIKPETKTAIGTLEKRAKDPVTWIALASMIATGFFGGKVHDRRKAVVE